MDEPIKRGRGRPKKAEKLERVTVYLPRESRLKVEAHGFEWLRQIIQRAKGPKPPDGGDIAGGNGPSGVAAKVRVD